jgi:hypothetical protein
MGKRMPAKTDSLPMTSGSTLRKCRLRTLQGRAQSTLTGQRYPVVAKCKYT